ncbi:MAG: acyl carrier protein [Flavobacteriales bacterium]|nr:acyl carrier protein [Flavobacteriales bacterium]
MDRNELRAAMVQVLMPRAARLGMHADELNDELDLLRSGLLDSLGFVDLVVELEKRSGREVDLMAAMERPGGSTMGGLVELFTRSA